ncbi:glycosyltransferase family 4 protein [Shewanella sp. SM73]|uniref:glycosyltransferase family 4 protein n=1 Tax=Shewanella sp. SM73 TaxID=2912806 RepID=UPI0021D9EE50|nr:glycosyltransferase family 4 protein [Shewanella sp. SM73]MCU8031121.1 glycosyltransferase family 4 protein [Shewanella sp. SM73]
MNILIPVFSFGRGGGERVLSLLASELVKNGNRVFFVSPESGNIPYYPTEAEIFTFPDTKKFSRSLNFIINYFNCWKKCRNLDADVAIANYHITALLVLFLKRNTKKFYYIQANEAKLCPRFLRKIFAFLTYFLPLNKIVNSKTILPNFINNYIAVIPAGIDLNLYSSKKLPLINSVDKVKIGIVGRKEPYKGTIELINALSNLDQGLKSRIKLHIAIHIPQDAIGKLWDFEFFEINNDTDLSDFYKSNDVVIAVGLIENGAFHYPCAEAMASGRLVISNYSPLHETQSVLKISDFSEINVLTALEQIFNMSEDEISEEVTSNLLKINDCSWEKIGKKMNKILSEH